MSILSYNVAGRLEIEAFHNLPSDLSATDIAMCGGLIAVSARNKENIMSGKILLFRKYHARKGLRQLQEITGDIIH